MGIGNMLAEWGCDCADRDGVEAYLVATQPAIPLYKRFVFDSVEEQGFPRGYLSTYMVRPSPEQAGAFDFLRDHRSCELLLEARLAIRCF